MRAPRRFAARMTPSSKASLKDEPTFTRSLRWRRAETARDAEVDHRMHDRKRNFFVGLTALAGVVGFVYLVFIFGEVPAWVTDSYRVTVTMDHAGGITPGSRVRLNGVDVGHVHSIELQDDPTDGVLIYCEIESAYEIPSDARVTS